MEPGITCPICKADHWHISSITTLKYGPGNIITYRCNSCKSTWQVSDDDNKIISINNKEIENV